MILLIGMNTTKKVKEQKKLAKIIKKSKDITLMSLDDYKIYIDDYIKKVNILI